jgi:branched-chain amino acid transport system ATP-binding protein
MSVFLEIESLDLKYGSITALRNVSLTVNKGDIVSLIGANGAGKSTLLKAITGLMPIAAGSIRFDDTILASIDASGKKKILSTDKIVAKGISLVPEGRGIFTEMTVRENLEMGAFLVTDTLKIEENISAMYDLFPILGERRMQKAGSLSGGEQQMLAIARALMSSPRLLLLDEPALGLAPLVIKQIFETIIRINRENGVTIFLVEQNAKMALTISTRGYVMETGKIVLEDSSNNLLQNHKVKAAYLGE